jgi:hypothetical protein
MEQSGIRGGSSLEQYISLPTDEENRPHRPYTATMCGRYTLRTPWQRLAEHYGLRVTDLPWLFAPRFNVAPTQAVQAIGPNREGQPAPAFFPWGLVPG